MYFMIDIHIHVFDEMLFLRKPLMSTFLFHNTHELQILSLILKFVEYETISVLKLTLLR